MDFCAFAIGVARDQAWSTAVRLADLPPHQLEEEIAKHGAVVAALGKDIRAPGWPLNIGLGLIRVRETRPVPVVIKALQIE